MTTHYAEPNFIDYDAVQRVFSLLVQAALRKRVTTFEQVQLAIQGWEIEQVFRNHVTLSEGYPSADETVAVIAVVARACQDRNLPPLTVLITKEGRNVGTGFWKDSPLGDLWTEYHTEKGRRQFELHWRAQCYAFFDPFSAMNESLAGYIKHVYKVAKAQQHEYKGIDLYEALSNAEVPSNGIPGPVTNTEKHRWIRDHFTFNENHDAIVNHNLKLPSEELTEVGVAPQHKALITIKADGTPWSVIGVAFAAHLAMGVQPTGLLEFNVKHVNLNDTERGKVVKFTETWVGSGRGRWKYNVRCKIERPEDGALIYDTLEIDVDPTTGGVTGRAPSGYNYTVVAELVVGEA